MVKFIKLSFISSCIVTLIGCESISVTESLYASTEVGVSKKVERCRVLEVREVNIRDHSTVEANSAIGTGVGAAAGLFGGSYLGGGSGSAWASSGLGLLGGIAGNLAGKKIGESTGTRKGLEYSVLMSSGEERTTVQDFMEGDRIIKPGETCRLQMSYDSKNRSYTGAARVLPADHLAEKIQKPKQSTFY
ncbi:TPA: hypothetical protein NGR22_004732 [Vibrio parahaemolyticus]|nr:hypothetical protein [Vibrio parahaemolyticus]